MNGGLQVVYVPPELRFEPRNPSYGLFLVGCPWPICVDFGAFWGAFEAFLGLIMELEGIKRLFNMGKSSRTQGCFGANNGPHFRGHRGGGLAETPTPTPRPPLGGPKP